MSVALLKDVEQLMLFFQLTSSQREREKIQPLYMALLDLEKTFDRVPHQLICYALHVHGVPEIYRLGSKCYRIPVARCVVLTVLTCS